MDALVLAGGLGTRLQSVVSNVPKPMAPIGSMPFIELILRQLTKAGVDRIILLTGHLHEIIESYFGKEYLDVPLIYSRERVPLGTGGAIKQALPLVSGEYALILNGDTFFDVDYQQLVEFHRRAHPDLTIALKPVDHCSRYGTVLLNGSRIIDFQEKGSKDRGIISGGVYVVRADLYKGLSLPNRFSFEEDFLVPFVKEKVFHGMVNYGYFIDIGIPNDYARAQEELQKFRFVR